MKNKQELIYKLIKSYPGHNIGDICYFDNDIWLWKKDDTVVLHSPIEYSSYYTKIFEGTLISKDTIIIQKVIETSRYNYNNDIVYVYEKQRYVVLEHLFLMSKLKCYPYGGSQKDIKYIFIKNAIECIIYYFINSAGECSSDYYDIEHNLYDKYKNYEFRKKCGNVFVSKDELNNCKEQLICYWRGFKDE